MKIRLATENGRRVLRAVIRRAARPFLTRYYRNSSDKWAFTFGHASTPDRAVIAAVKRIQVGDARVVEVHDATNKVIRRVSKRHNRIIIDIIK